jgi:hypothetical protein
VIKLSSGAGILSALRMNYASKREIKEKVESICRLMNRNWP